MGKIYRLSEKASCFEQTLKLIEKSFNYKKPDRFDVDFALLIDKSNHEHCFILLDDDENIIAHVGTKDKFLTLKNETFKICLIGGIAVEEKYRGKGYFQTLLQDVIAEKRSDSTIFLLWSDNTKLYNKFGFHLCGIQYEIDKYLENKKVNDFEKIKYHELKNEEKNQIQNLYHQSFSKIHLTLDRSEKDWREIEKLTSSDLYIKRRDSIITDYFFINKGKDLQGIIYEFGTNSEITILLESMSHYGKVWTGKPIIETKNIQYQFFMAPGDVRLFARFILNYTNFQISIRDINSLKQEVFFDFNGELYSLEVEEFLRGIFGPGVFEELEVPSFFISGLESI
jgi:N-acetylglutamate synthase-like GNAT family acetyltransferase